MDTYKTTELFAGVYDELQPTQGHLLYPGRGPRNINHFIYMCCVTIVDRYFAFARMLAINVMRRLRLMGVLKSYFYILPIKCITICDESPCSLDSC